MNIRCAFCQTPYTLSRVDMLDALQEMDANSLTHYDAHCPRCRRATQIPRQRMEMAMPKWREELKEFEAEMREHPQQEAPAPTPESAPVAEAEAKPQIQTPKKPKPAEAKATTAAPKAKKATAAPKEKKASKKSK